MARAGARPQERRERLCRARPPPPLHSPLPLRPSNMAPGRYHSNVPGRGGPDAARRTPPHGAHARPAARAQREAGPRGTLGNEVAAPAAAAPAEV